MQETKQTEQDPAYGEAWKQKPPKKWALLPVMMDAINPQSHLDMTAPLVADTHTDTKQRS